MTLKIRHFFIHVHPSAFLLAAQLLLLVPYAVFDGMNSGRALISALSALVLVLAVWVVLRSPTANWIAWMLALPAFLLSLLSAFINNPHLTAWSALLEAGLYFYTAASLIVYMMGDSRVTTDELFAAGATFTLLAWGFAYAYLVCQAWDPGSIVSVLVSGRELTFIELLALSFTNLSATGLGDVMPVSPAARILGMLEQFAGVGYVAVVVSRLVGMTLRQAERKRN